MVFINLFQSKALLDTVENIKFWLAGNRCVDFWEQEAKQEILIKELTDQSMDDENKNAQTSNDKQAIDALIAIAHQLL